ncbi:hypothetical protein NLI96_g8114 [Meripilus lineatus]|uniref:Protein kinase domain-containing protein n=1 Tax=Meripilus lineatus TaxID=2056292 RepID=A0AAD5V340_9APHY|nr:hypothetical protein NLI96_g8114 [Physisporinus lineatus]
MATPQEASKTPQPQKPHPRSLHESLDRIESFWLDHSEWLEEKGYMLRPRYRHGWVPSWVAENKPKPFMAEDQRYFGHPDTMDATRISDNALVMMKLMNDSLENEIALYFSTEPLASHPRNHCVPIYEVLHVPDPTGDDDEIIIVMPLLRPFYDPRFKSVGEAVEFFRQIFEGLQFMHEHNVAHRDVSSLNIMMDPCPTFPEMFHPAAISRSRDFKSSAKFHTRTSRPTKYLFIDFGLSEKFEPGQDRKVIPICGGDRSPPEFQHDGAEEEIDPFPTDVYCIGNLIRRKFLRPLKGVDFIQPLVEDMIQEDPTKRPTMDEVVLRYDEMVKSLSYWRLRSMLVERDEPMLIVIFLAVAHIYRTTIHIFTFRSPIPRPPS